MHDAAILLVLVTGLWGCSGARHASTCEVVSPPQVIVPGSQDDQRIEAQGSGEPPGDENGQGERHCP
ncbi:hypothetical protein ACFW0H_07395 [Pseudomonas sp. CR3202]|uniref:hypothetical protein n=1 Tax=Pseudomonas sp. CR3202 TaxID=3351532 RepID=UPI003BF2726C